MATPCSLQARAVDEALAGTAPVARTWVVVEQPGPWGRDALTDSRLPDPVRAWLLSAKARGIGVLLARHPDRPERAEATGHHVWVARSSVGGTRLRHAVVDDLDALSRWDIDGLVDGVLPAFGTASAAPLLLVCTHSGRDQCCALHGRALIAGLLAQVSPEQRMRVWESSHIGGHRFAPVTLSLPSGAVHGRLSVDDALDVLQRADAGLLRPDLLRGRSSLPQPLQAAEIAVRIDADCDGADDLDVLLIHDERAVPVELGWPVPTTSVMVEVRHVDGRAWEVVVASTMGAAHRAESCGGLPQSVHSWVASIPLPRPPWA